MENNKYNNNKNDDDYYIIIDYRIQLYNQYIIFISFCIILIC